MDSAFHKAEELAASIKQYAEAKIEEVKLTAAEKSSHLIANLVAGAVVAVVFIFFIGFASIALAFLLGTLIGKLWIGFLLVAFFYLLIGIAVWVARGKLIRLPLMNAMIEQLFKLEDDETD
jgi:hypothetical protein